MNCCLNRLLISVVIFGAKLTSATKFNISALMMPKQVSSFGAGCYKGDLFVIDYNLEYRSTLENDWQISIIPDIPLYMHNKTITIKSTDQTTVQFGDLVYFGFPNLVEEHALSNSVLLKYNLKTNSFIPPQTYLSHVNLKIKSPCVTVNTKYNRLYILGHINLYYEILSDNWKLYEVSQNNYHWKKSAGCAAFNSYIFMFGGSDTNEIQKYDIRNSEWTILQTTFLERNLNGLNCILYNGKIYCTGGYAYLLSVVSTVHVFDPESLTVDSITYELNEARYNHRMVIFHKCLYVLGGQQGSQKLVDKIEFLCTEYKLSSNWEESLFLYGTIASMLVIIFIISYFHVQWAHS